MPAAIPVNWQATPFVNHASYADCAGGEFSVLPLVAARVAPFADTAVRYMTWFLLTVVFSTSFYVRGILHSIGAYSMLSAGSYWLSPGLKANQMSQGVMGS